MPPFSPSYKKKGSQLSLERRHLTLGGKKIPRLHTLVVPFIGPVVCVRGGGAGGRQGGNSGPHRFEDKRKRPGPEG